MRLAAVKHPVHRQNRTRCEIAKRDCYTKQTDN